MVGARAMSAAGIHRQANDSISILIAAGRRDSCQNPIGEGRFRRICRRHRKEIGVCQACQQCEHRLASQCQLGLGQTVTLERIADFVFRLRRDRDPFRIDEFLERGGFDKRVIGVLGKVSNRLGGYAVDCSEALA